MSNDTKDIKPDLKPSETRPLIPESFLDVPSQRLYYLSLGVLCQAIKCFDILRYWFLSEGQQSFARKWMLVDFLYCASLVKLRIPRLRYSLSVVLLQILSLWAFDAFIFGAITVHVGSGGSWKSLSSVRISGPQEFASTPRSSGVWEMVSGLGLGFLTGSASAKDAHLLGQHTVRMSPIGTAQLNPSSQSFCLASSGDSILIPILLNNTNPTSVRYSLTPLGYSQDTEAASSQRLDFFELSAKELKSIEQSRLERLQVARSAASKKDTDEYDEYDDEDEEDGLSSSRKEFSSLQKTQTMAHIRISKPGVVRLERVLDSSNVEARYVYPNEVTVVPCPNAEFSAKNAVARADDIRCAAPGMLRGGGEELQLAIDISGVPPLSMRWYREVGGRREPFMVEGIEDPEHSHSHTPSRARNTPAHVTVPLTVTLDALGTHSYVLDSVTDALGNTVQVGVPASISQGSIAEQGNESNTSDPRYRRSVTVLRRPVVSFKNCAPDKPAYLSIGSEAPLTIATTEGDSADAPWDVVVKYEPSTGDEDGKAKKRKNKAWTKTLETEDARRELIVRANAPGQYTINGVRGKHCEGDVLSPDTCKVVERPLPTAEIEWKKIHECSGDTGVSASLVLHGTPPFYVYYTMQHDTEPPRELVKTFTTSRGELTIQPERSGHYIFKFTQLSDLIYKRVDLKGPSIDQVVHPPASAEFVPSAIGDSSGRAKRRINSCSGNMVDVDVELRGTGPWNLEARVVGPKGSDIVRIENITTARKTLQLPIPKSIDRDGGSFDIDLVSVEDSYGCKRALSTPGISVNVRRVPPTAKFYGQKDKRHVTILDTERASLPLRLTGEGPWRLKYRRNESPQQIHTATLHNPNDELQVVESGVYEIIEVADSQCPGSVIANDATYKVDHVPRPAAKLSPETQSVYSSYNGSHILPPVCEGAGDFVDLDLTGRPPFQIMYNVARDNEMGGTKLLDQPTFSSIQPHTRFQLHTTEAGRVYYEVKQIGDAAYPLAKNKNAVIPRSQRLLFEQHVSKRPSARFKTTDPLSYCLNDALTAQEAGSSDGVVILDGSPPFHIQLSIRNIATSTVHTETVEVYDKNWKLNIPSYSFESIAPHLVTIESVRDASNCEQAIPDTLHRTIRIDVAETAAIVPFDQRQDFCVGDVLQFQLEGTPPWNIGYRVNGRTFSQTAKVSPFSIAQQQAGEFTVASIAHQQQKCSTAVTDLRYNIHPLPSARVGHGKRIVQDIHEGDQAEIVFTLIGEPPFTFTYQRTELNPKKGTQGKVLETHTVSGVTTKEYSIFSALEGTWTVTFISDRYCRYPPIPQDGSLERNKH